jgi:hypothetical protein
VEEEAAVRNALPDRQPRRHTPSTGRTPERNARLHWPTVLFGALPASYLALPAAAGILFGGFFALSLRPLGLVILVAGALGWVGTISLWATAGSRVAVGRRTARGLGLGIVGAVLFALIKLFNHDLGDRLALFPVILVVIVPVVVPVVIWSANRAVGLEATRRASLLAAVLIPAAILVLLPHRVARFLPRFAVESRGFRVALVAVLALAVVPWPVALLLRPQLTGTATQLGGALAPSACSAEPTTPTITGVQKVNARGGFRAAPMGSLRSGSWPTPCLTNPSGRTEYDVAVLAIQTESTHIDG